jgi:hypothetical protein
MVRAPIFIWVVKELNINYLEDKGIEEDMSSINRYLQRFATKIVQTYTFL